MKPHQVCCPSSELPTSAQAQDWGQVHLRAQAPDSMVQEVSAWRERIPVRRISVQAGGGLGNDLLQVGEGARVDIATLSPEDLADGPGRLPEAISGPLVAWAVPRLARDKETGSGLDLVHHVRALGDAGWPVLLEPGEPLLRGEVDLLGLLDHYLFHRTLTVPVEPFHGLLMALVQKRPHSLWDRWWGAPLDSFFIDDRGNVSWSEITCRLPELRFGTREDPVSTWRSSQAFKALTARYREPGTVDARCGECDVRIRCGGVLRALDPEADCETWQEVLERLRLAATALQSGQRSQA